MLRRQNFEDYVAGSDDVVDLGPGHGGHGGRPSSDLTGA